MKRMLVLLIFLFPFFSAGTSSYAFAQSGDWQVSNLQAWCKQAIKGQPNCFSSALLYSGIKKEIFRCDVEAGATGHKATQWFYVLGDAVRCYSLKFPFSEGVSIDVVKAYVGEKAPLDSSLAHGGICPPPSTMCIKWPGYWIVNKNNGNLVFCDTLFYEGPNYPGFCTFKVDYPYAHPSVRP